MMQKISAHTNKTYKAIVSFFTIIYTALFFAILPIIIIYLIIGDEGKKSYTNDGSNLFSTEFFFSLAAIYFLTKLLGIFRIRNSNIQSGLFFLALASSIPYAKSLIEYDVSFLKCIYCHIFINIDLAFFSATLFIKNHMKKNISNSIDLKK
ncbi:MULTISPECIES: hypothetical protein [unclassified Serratia (in: enterobacteria)]|uniref:hypothetical protein n=1 Tax=unclassified Serratia (in: enterobacteria) TaxID=2647522 RepID=UPI0030763FAB